MSSDPATTAPTTLHAAACDPAAWDPAAFEARKRGSFAQVLFKAARLVNAEGLRRVRTATGTPGVRPAHTALFPHIPFEGIRLSALAERVGVSKQAVQQLVDDLEAMGVVARQPDPADRRAKRICWTERGKQGLVHGLGVLDGLQAELEARVGRSALADAHGVLLAVIEALEPAHASDTPEGAAPDLRSHSAAPVGPPESNAQGHGSQRQRPRRPDAPQAKGRP